MGRTCAVLFKNNQPVLVPCTQLGHQAANCTTGTINWRQIYGEDAFRIKPPIYWSDIVKRQEAKEVDFEDLEQRARHYARVCWCAETYVRSECKLNCFENEAMEELEFNTK